VLHTRNNFAFLIADKNATTSQAFEFFDSSCVFCLHESKEKIHMCVAMNKKSRLQLYHRPRRRIINDQFVDG
jgi:hypothetical protein